MYKRRHGDKGERKWRQVIYRGVGCGNCEVRELCTKQKARTIAREDRRKLLEEMRERRCTLLVEVRRKIGQEG